jgi:uncharacterized tellurite resistance protein B-like protein
MPFPADLDPADPLHRWKLAFAVFVAKLIVDADGIVDFGELKLLSQAFPDDLLQRVGFLDRDGGYTAAYRDSYTGAMRELPNRLELDDKLELITIFHRTCMADGELIQAELLVLREAAEVLGVPLAVLSKHLAGLRSISTVKG